MRATIDSVAGLPEGERRRRATAKSKCRRLRSVVFSGLLFGGDRS